jgi:hypothetical protein
MNDLLEIYVPRLNQGEFRYLITGSVASMYYGEIRNTLDVDIVIELPPRAVKTLIQLFPENEFYLPPAEVMEVEAKRRQRGHFNILHHESGARADVYVHAGDAFQNWAFDHMVTAEINGMNVPLAPPEYVIVSKLEYFREGGSEKHIRDINGILAQETTLQGAAIAPFIAAKGLQDLWQLHVASKLDQTE